MFIHTFLALVVSVFVNTYSSCVETLQYDVSVITLVEVHLYQRLFENGMARNDMILKTLARILIVVVHLCLRGSMEEHTGA